MAEYETMSLDELRRALKREEGLLDDAEQERQFLGKQTGMHINASEFARIDRDIERYGNHIAQIRAAITEKNG